MVHNKVDIPLCKELERCFFREHHTQHRVYIFHTGFLTAAHSVTIIDARPDNALDTVFQRIRIPEFCTAVGEYVFEHRKKGVSIKPFFQPVKYTAHGSSCIAVH